MTDETGQAYPATVRLVGVKIRDCGEVKKLDAKGVSLRRGDRVLLEVDGDVTYGVVYSEPSPTPFAPPMRVMKSILRKANQEEASLITRLERLSQEATAYCRVKAAEFKLNMKLVEVYGAMQRRQLTFVYTADERIDFRELVRDLARRFGGRIEMRQVGAREEARRLGGIDTCGLVLCCASFLTDVKPVTVKQARSLGLAVEDPRLLGVCGRLKCCLMFEMMDAQGSGAGQGLITPDKSAPRPPSGRPS
ncbi:PSP1 domain-containing protein [Nitrospira moscoviensis]|uniref:PSP1 domain-containing protein n=1 Tax=Nitrospira moscoviensis TaxID=42253 RepID=UPI001651A63B|nr:regulatory iron-sulfur-containing complex subunit RicT [Nitrospira moscoviensis]